MDKIELNNGIQMPLLGFGVFQITDQEICIQMKACLLSLAYSKQR